MTKINCENCPCVPVCINKRWSDVLLDCEYIKDYLAEEGKGLKISETMVVGVPVLKKRFMVFRNKRDKIHFGLLQTERIEQWGVAYGGRKSVG